MASSAAASRASGRSALFLGPTTTSSSRWRRVPALVSLLPTLMMLGGFVVAYLHVYRRSRDAPRALADAQSARSTASCSTSGISTNSTTSCSCGRRSGSAALFWKGGDGAIIDGLGPDGVAARVIDVTRNVVRLQSGYVYHYAFAMLIGVAALRHLVSCSGGSADVRLGILSGLLILPLVGALAASCCCAATTKRRATTRAGSRCGRRSSPSSSRSSPGASSTRPRPASSSSSSTPGSRRRSLYQLGVDGISMPFVLLTTFLMPICIAASLDVDPDRASRNT